MTENLILKNVAKHISLDENETAYFLSILTEKKYPKKSIILKDGDICSTINFVQSGTLRAFYRSLEGKESTIMFAISDWWITDIACFINQQPAILNIETIEESVIFHLRKEDLDDLYLKIPKFDRFFRIIMQNAYIREQLRVIQNLSLSAEQRYYIFRDKYPQVAKQVTQKRIASYLGITPEFLSTIRAIKK